MKILLAVLAVLCSASVAFAQHPAFPWVWNSYAPIHWGTVVGHKWIPPEYVSTQVYLRQPEGIPEQTETQIVEVPGYYVVETTKGTVFPERWVIENTGANVWVWRKLPSYFQAR
jgi:hypothetical protein